MNRRSLLAAGTAGALLGVSGCLDNLESLAGRDGEDVPGCTQPDGWDDDITSGPTNPDADSIAGRRDCVNAGRPEPTGDVCETFEVEGENGDITEFHSAGIEPYPDPPSAFDEETLRSYVSTYERAYTQNSEVSDHGEGVVAFSFTVHDTHTIDATTEITIIVVEFGFGYRNEPGWRGYTDAFGELAVYGIDETGIVRSDAEYSDENEIDPEEFPDPVEAGDLLQCF